MAIKANKKLVNINLDVELIEAIDNLAEKLGMSRSALVNLTMRGVVMGETSETLGRLLGLSIEAREKSENQDAKNGVLITA